MQQNMQLLDLGQHSPTYSSPLNMPSPLPPVHGASGSLEQVYAGDGSDGFPSRDYFTSQIAEYLENLNPRKREKALMSDVMYSSVISVLRSPKNTSLETAQFRFWVKKMFRMGDSNGSNVVIHENRPVAVKSQIYDILVSCHGRCAHGGRDKTSANVRQYYSWIPKELIARFVKICPSCHTKRNANRMPEGFDAGLPTVRLPILTGRRTMQSITVPRAAASKSNGQEEDDDDDDDGNDPTWHPTYVRTNLSPPEISNMSASARSSFSDLPSELPTPKTNSFTGLPSLDDIINNSSQRSSIEPSYDWHADPMSTKEGMQDDMFVQKHRPSLQINVPPPAWQHFTMSGHSNKHLGQHLFPPLLSPRSPHSPGSSASLFEPTSALMSQVHSASSGYSHLSYDQFVPPPSAVEESFPDQKLLNEQLYYAPDPNEITSRLQTIADQRGLLHPTSDWPSPTKLRPPTFQTEEFDAENPEFTDFVHDYEAV